MILTHQTGAASGPASGSTQSTVGGGAHVCYPIEKEGCLKKSPIYVFLNQIESRDLPSICSAFLHEPGDETAAL